MPIFYLTFGQKFPWRNGWVEVQAPDRDTAIKYVEELFGQEWANLYETMPDRNLFPAGKLGETIK